jgi:hypothetical protein
MPYKIRFPGRRPFTNSNKQYKDIFLRKNLNLINQLTTPVSKQMPNRALFRSIPHIWKTGDKYYKLAATYYDDASLWWVIAKFNNKPTEGHLKIGDKVMIPLPLSQALRSL